MIICLTSLYPKNEKNKCVPILIVDKNYLSGLIFLIRNGVNRKLRKLVYMPGSKNIIMRLTRLPV